MTDCVPLLDYCDEPACHDFNILHSHCLVVHCIALHSPSLLSCSLLALSFSVFFLLFSPLFILFPSSFLFFSSFFSFFFSFFSYLFSSFFIFFPLLQSPHQPFFIFTSFLLVWILSRHCVDAAKTGRVSIDSRFRSTQAHLSPSQSIFTFPLYSHSPSVFLALPSFSFFA